MLVCIVTRAKPANPPHKPARFGGAGLLSVIPVVAIRTLSVVAVFFFLWLVTGASAESRPATDCLKGLGPKLIAGGFTGSTDCRRDQILVGKVGELQAAGRTFAIYAYRYRLRPVCPECAVHGGQRILVMTSGQYAGQYGVIDYRARVGVRASNLIVQPPTGDLAVSASLVVVRFTASGPPRRILFAGEPISFGR